MGTRYFISVKCSECGAQDDDVYYAPTCGFTTHECACGHVTDLEKYTGISYEEASSAVGIGQLVRAAVSEFQTQEAVETVPFCDGGCEGMNEEWFAVSDCCSICGLQVRGY